MERGFSLTLNQQRKRDMSAVLNFFLWLSRKADINLTEYEHSLKDLIGLVEKIKQLPVDSKLQINLKEFLMVYTSAQYMMKAMNSYTGTEYLSDTLGQPNSPEWITKQKRHFTGTCEFLIKECQSKFDDLPEFAKERMRIEDQMKPFES